MAKNVAIGIQNFEDIIKGKYFYIDKTDFIKEWWDSGDSVTLITRPRRFGKTLNMSMVEQFFSVDYADRGDLVEGLSIWKNEEYRQIQGTYPVIFLSFARIKESKFSLTKEKISEILIDLYIKHSYLRESDVLTEADRLFYARMMSEAPRESDLTSSLHKLSDYMYRYYGKKTIIILDEYDTPMQEAYINGYWDELNPGGTNNKVWYYGPTNEFDLVVDDNMMRATFTPTTVNALTNAIAWAPSFKEYFDLDPRISVTNTIDLTDVTITEDMTSGVTFDRLVFSAKTQAQLTNILGAFPATTPISIDPTGLTENMVIPETYNNVFVKTVPGVTVKRTASGFMIIFK